jgi:hypothetical protein
MRAPPAVTRSFISFRQEGVTRHLVHALGRRGHRDSSPSSQDKCDVFVELSVLLAQRQNRNADDREDEVQPLHVAVRAGGHATNACC